MTGISASAPLSPAMSRLTAVAIAMVVLTLAAPRLHAWGGGYLFWGMVIAMAMAAWWASGADDGVDDRTALKIVVAAAVAMRFAMLFTDPYLSSDLFRYIWDGRVAGNGINPFRYLPSAPELASLRDAVIYPNINRADYAPTIYPPVAQMTFWLITRVSESVFALKFAMVALEALGVAAMLVVLSRLDLPARRIAAYIWHPLPVWEIAGNGHVDAMMIALMLVSLALFLERPALVAAGVATLAALVKPTALLALPVYWRPWDWRMPCLVAAIMAGFYLPYLGVGWGVLGFASGYFAEEGYKAGGGFWYPDILQLVTGQIPGIGRGYMVLSGLALGALALTAGFRTDRSPAAAVRSLTLLVMLFLILLTPHYPWYYLAAVPFLAVYPRSATLWVLTVGCLQMHDPIPGDHLVDYGHRQVVYFSAVLVAAVWDARTLVFANARSITGAH
jgi:alpha-1,6-mannosyltransferase